MTKRELKVGDLVKIARHRGAHGFSEYRSSNMGTVGRIETLFDDGRVHVKVDGGYRFGQVSGLDLIEPREGSDPIPDPFAPGEYVTCIVESGGHRQVRGDVLLVDEYIHHNDDWFCVEGRSIYPNYSGPIGFKKSRYRASTPEEIAAYKAKQKAGEGITSEDATLTISVNGTLESASEECSEPTLNNEGSVGCESDEEPRITFTVGGQEFFIGQRVWGTRNSRECVKEGQEAEICGHRNFNLAVRVLSDSYVYEIPKDSLQFSPPAPHEWKRGDWARHKDGRKAFVCGAWLSHGAYGPQQLVVSFENEAITGIPASEFTFIGHTEAPE